ncbi:MAG: tyrosine-type recombinase/integrase [Rhodospirillaceae bacterium]|nr:tyrosine-type recombinase/integrase [Rhodospirillaceae bacterium]
MRPNNHSTSVFSRYTYASHAVMNGVPVPVVSRLLGHSDTRMTLRYAHLADREIEAAAERIGQAIATIMSIGYRSD